MTHEQAIQALEALSMIGRDVKRRCRTTWKPTLYRLNEHWYVNLSRTYGRSRTFYASAATFQDATRKLLVEICSNQRTPADLREGANQILIAMQPSSGKA